MKSNTLRIAVVRIVFVGGGIAGVHLQNLQNVGGVEILTM
jgi:hypothetical protein